MGRFGLARLNLNAVLHQLLLFVCCTFAGLINSSFAFELAPAAIRVLLAAIVVADQWLD